MNIIFLDIDGVLNTERYIKEQRKNSEENDVGFRYDFNFDPICMKNLKTLIEKVKPYIVLSSSWRNNEDLIIEIRKNLKLYGIRCGIIDITPRLRNTSRGAEIKKWLDEHVDFLSENNSSYIILDDEDDMGELSHSLIKCDQYYGFDDSKLKEALELFDKKNIIPKDFTKVDFITALNSWDQLDIEVKCIHKQHVTIFKAGSKWRSDFKVDGGMILDGEWFIEKLNNIGE